MAHRRRKSRRGALSGAVPVDSFADIAFLLIIYFLIVTTLVKTQGMITDIPSGQKSDAADVDKTPTVSVHDGQIRYNDQVVDLRGLRRELDQLGLPARADSSDRIVLLETTGDTRYQEHFEVVAVISAAGGVIGMFEEAEGEE